MRIAALCAEAVGIINALNQATLNYLKTRKQFGVAIGTFQALKHKMADMLIAAEQARSMAIIAAVHADSKDAADRQARHRCRQGLHWIRRVDWSGSTRCKCTAAWEWSMNSS